MQRENSYILTSFEGEIWYNCSYQTQTTTGVRSTRSRSNHRKGYLQMATSNSTSTTIEFPLVNNSICLVDCLDGDLANVKWYSEHPRKNRKTYVVRQQGTIRIHRVIMSRVLGRELSSDELVDHINGDVFDNRRCNLRLVSSSENTQNSKKSIRNTSGYKGVTWNKSVNKWQAAIKKNKKNYHLGLFTDPVLAHEAYKQKAKELFGEYARFE